jgi:hypothetical protein
LLGGIAYLSHAYQIVATDPGSPTYQTVLSQLLAAVAGKGIFYGISIFAIVVVLCLSANTSFADFPRLGRAVAEDGYLPHAFADRGRRLVYSDGICVLAALAALLFIAFDGVTDNLPSLRSRRIPRIHLVASRDGRTLEPRGGVTRATECWSTGPVLLRPLLRRWSWSWPSSSQGAGCVESSEASAVRPAQQQNGDHPIGMFLLEFELLRLPKAMKRSRASGSSFPGMTFSNRVTYFDGLTVIALGLPPESAK